MHPTQRTDWLPLGLLAALGIAGTWAIVWQPLAAAALATALALYVILSTGTHPVRLFLGCLSVVLGGYAFLGRSFAYLGAAPVYVGELALALGLLCVVLAGGLTPVPFFGLIAAFILQQALCTFPHLGTYGLECLRDAVLWGYALFALIAAAFVIRTGSFAGVHNLYRRVLPWFLLWAPVATFVRLSGFGENGPFVPGTTVPLLDLKAGDTAVHLAGVLAFLYLNLHLDGVRNRVRASNQEWLLWLLWFGGVLVATSTSRGSLLAILATLAVLVCFYPNGNWKKMAAMIAVACLVLTALSFRVETNYVGRAISPEQLASNFESLFVEKNEGELEGTRRWRVEWWKQIVDYTVFGEHFWNGKGYGINLADEDGFQVAEDHSLRAPHNAHLTILARSGVPGFALWVALQVAFAGSLVRAHLRARRLGHDRWARLDLWLLAYWLAFLINGSFDVFLEGPQGGIWFWSLYGFGLAALALQSRPPVPTPDPA